MHIATVQSNERTKLKWVKERIKDWSWLVWLFFSLEIVLNLSDDIISHRSPAFTSSLRTINSIINNAKYCAASQTCCCCCRETLMGRHEKYHRTTRSLEALASSLDIRSIIHWINMQTKVSEQKNVKERKRKKKIDMVELSRLFSSELLALELLIVCEL